MEPSFVELRDTVVGLVADVEACIVLARLTGHTDLTRELKALRFECTKYEGALAGFKNVAGRPNSMVADVTVIELLELMKRYLPPSIAGNFSISNLEELRVSVDKLRAKIRD